MNGELESSPGMLACLLQYVNCNVSVSKIRNHQQLAVLHALSTFLPHKYTFQGRQPGLKSEEKNSHLAEATVIAHFGHGIRQLNAKYLSHVMEKGTGILDLIHPDTNIPIIVLIQV